MTEEYEINMTDITLIESQGNFEVTTDIMKQDQVIVPDWVLSTQLSIDSSLGIAFFDLDLFSDGKVVITDYQPSIGDVYYNPDISCLVTWLKENGWKRIEPFPNLVKDDIDFWKHFWETGLLDSDFLEDRYGQRDKENL